MERLRDELDKLLTATAPDRGLATLARLGLIDAVLPELAPTRGCVAGRDRPDVWTHTLETIRQARKIPDDIKLLGDKCLYDVGLFSRLEHRGHDLAHLGRRSYLLASEVLQLLSEEVLPNFHTQKIEAQ